MTDRSEIMRAVKSRDTTPELTVRRLARQIAPGYRLHRGDLHGKPDLAWITRKRAIFVHGCFWHGHDCKRGARVPKQNRDYWREKIAKNRARDAANQQSLREAGWCVLTVWECELKDLAAVSERLSTFLTEAPSR